MGHRPPGGSDPQHRSHRSGSLAVPRPPAERRLRGRQLCFLFKICFGTAPRVVPPFLSQLFLIGCSFQIKDSNSSNCSWGICSQEQLRADIFKCWMPSWCNLSVCVAGSESATLRSLSKCVNFCSTEARGKEHNKAAYTKQKLSVRRALSQASVVQFQLNFIYITLKSQQHSPQVI